ncbi:transposase [Streptomyces sp. LN590]|uniref:transposase n=1 Tax=Streptomyces sp. LN590 TaxID=3112980 RepID=UPI003716F6BC
MQGLLVARGREANRDPGDPVAALYVLTPVEFNSAAPTCDGVAHRFGNAADHSDRVRRCPSDMTDAEWAVVRPLLPVPGWLHGRGGQAAYCHRAIPDAIRYLVDNGIKCGRCPPTSRRGTGSVRSSAADATTGWSRSSTTGCARRSARASVGPFAHLMRTRRLARPHPA